MAQVRYIGATLIISSAICALPVNQIAYEDGRNLNHIKMDNNASRTKKSYSGVDGETICVQVYNSYGRPITICRNEPTEAAYPNIDGSNGIGYENHRGSYGKRYLNQQGPYKSGNLRLIDSDTRHSRRYDPGQRFGILGTSYNSPMVSRQFPFSRSQVLNLDRYDYKTPLSLPYYRWKEREAMESVPNIELKQLKQARYGYSSDVKPYYANDIYTSSHIPELYGRQEIVAFPHGSVSTMPLLLSCQPSLLQGNLLPNAFESHPDVGTQYYKNAVGIKNYVDNNRKTILNNVKKEKSLKTHEMEVGSRGLSEIREKLNTHNDFNNIEIKKDSMYQNNHNFQEPFNPQEGNIDAILPKVQHDSKSDNGQYDQKLYSIQKNQNSRQEQTFAEAINSNEERINHIVPKSYEEKNNKEAQEKNKPRKGNNSHESSKSRKESNDNKIYILQEENMIRKEEPQKINNKDNLDEFQGKSESKKDNISTVETMYNKESGLEDIQKNSMSHNDDISEVAPQTHGEEHNVDFGERIESRENSNSKVALHLHDELNDNAQVNSNPRNNGIFEETPQNSEGHNDENVQDNSTSGKKDDSNMVLTTREDFVRQKVVQNSKLQQNDNNQRELQSHGEHNNNKSQENFNSRELTQSIEEREKEDAQKNLKPPKDNNGNLVPQTNEKRNDEQSQENLKYNKGDNSEADGQLLQLRNDKETQETSKSFQSNNLDIKPQFFKERSNEVTQENLKSSDNVNYKVTPQLLDEHNRNEIEEDSKSRNIDNIKGSSNSHKESTSEEVYESSKLSKNNTMVESKFREAGVSEEVLVKSDQTEIDKPNVALKSQVQHNDEEGLRNTTLLKEIKSEQELKSEEDIVKVQENLVLLENDNLKNAFFSGEEINEQEFSKNNSKPESQGKLNFEKDSSADLQ